MRTKHLGQQGDASTALELFESFRIFQGFFFLRWGLEGAPMQPVWKHSWSQSLQIWPASLGDENKAGSHP